MSLDVLDIFNLKKSGFDENTKFLRGLIVSGKKYSFGQPCIVQHNGDYTPRDINMMILNGPGIHSPHHRSISSSLIKFLDNYDINKHEVVDIDDKNIDFKTHFKKDILIEATRDENIGKSFVFRESIFHANLEDVINHSFLMRSWFKYNSLIRYDLSDFPIVNKPENLDMAIIVSFFPLADSIPVFSFKEIDGLSISISLSLLEDAGHYFNRINIFSVGLALNNYKHAVYEIDGEDVGFQKSFSGNEITRLVNYAAASIKTLDLYKYELLKKTNNKNNKEKEVAVNKQYVDLSIGSETSSTAATYQYKSYTTTNYNFV